MSWIPTADEFVVNVTLAGNQSQSDIAALSTGGFVVTWVTTAQVHPGFYDNFNIVARVYGAGASAGTGEFAANSILRDEQVSPALLGLPGGQFMIVYQDGSDATVGGTYITARAFDTSGTALFEDWRYAGGSGRYLESNPFAIALEDGAIVVVHGTEDGSVGTALDLAAESATRIFAFSGYDTSATVDYAQSLVPQSATALQNGDFAQVYQGFRGDQQSDVSAQGILLWIRTADGAPVGGPVQVNADTDIFSTSPVVATLADGSIVVAWTSYDSDPRFGGVGDIYFRQFTANGVAVGNPVLAHESSAGAQSSVDITALPDGGFLLAWAGAGIIARSFDANGVATTASFTVNNTTTSAHVDPHLALLASDEVAVSWTDLGSTAGTDVKARLLYELPLLPDCPVVTRAGTQNGISPTDQILTGPNSANSFYFAGLSGDDTITNFQKHDVLVANAALADLNGDGIVTFGSDRLLDLTSGGTVAIGAINPDQGLRYLGQACEGTYVYATATVRPFGAIEGLLGNNVLTGDAGDARGQIFFFDTALSLSLGIDRITRFGAKDVLVTTAKISDGNNDGIITFGSDKMINIGDTDIGLKGMNGKTITKVEFDGTVSRDGVDYYVYSLVGSAVGTEAIAPPSPPQKPLYFIGESEAVSALYKLTPGEDPVALYTGGASLLTTPFIFAGDVYLTNNAQLTRIDGETGVATTLGVVANPELAHYVLGTEYDGALYVSAFSDAAGGEIFRITPDSVIATPLDSVPGPIGSDPQPPFGFGGNLFYSGYTFDTGQELFVQNAITGATQIFDIAPANTGVADSYPGGFVAFDGDVYFSASDGAGGDLFRYDSATGTVQPITIGTGDESENFAVAKLVIGNRLYFTGNSQSSGTEIFSLAAGSDTPVLVANIALGAEGSTPLSLAAFDGDLLLSADDGMSGRELVRIDTATNAVTGFDLVAGSAASNPDDFIVLDSTLFFTAESAASGRELYRWVAGSNGPILLDVTPGVDSSFIWGTSPLFVQWNGDLLFQEKNGVLKLYETDTGATMSVDLMGFAGNFVEFSVP